MGKPSDSKKEKYKNLDSDRHKKELVAYILILKMGII